MKSPTNQVPLCVDLDGTWIRGDSLTESIRLFLCQKPLQFWRLGYWLIRGRPRLKAELARRTKVDFSAFALNPAFAEFIREEKGRGRRIILISATDERLARAAFEAYGVFDAFYASDGKINLKSAAKAAKLCELFGEGGFDYAGNERADFKVWDKARLPIVVNASGAVVAKARGRYPEILTFDCEG